MMSFDDSWGNWEKLLSTWGQTHTDIGQSPWQKCPCSDTTDSCQPLWAVSPIQPSKNAALPQKVFSSSSLRSLGWQEFFHICICTRVHELLYPPGAFLPFFCGIAHWLPCSPRAYQQPRISLPPHLNSYISCYNLLTKQMQTCTNNWLI